MKIAANGITINAEVTGDGPAMLLLHGFPHTWRVWHDVIPALARSHRVIAPDLRGLGETTRAEGGYDGVTLADDARALLDALDVEAADVVALDLGVNPAVLLALREPARVSRLVVMEAVLAGAEGFAPPWWFGFHSVVGLAEHVLIGHEREYIEFFLRAGQRTPHPVNDQFVAAYTGADALRCAFAHYRALPTTAEQLATETKKRLTMPVVALGAHPVGATLHRQLAPLADDLTGHLIDDCRHIIPLDRPDALLEHLAQAPHANS